MLDAMRHIYKPFIRPITAPSFTSPEGKVYHVSGNEMTFTEPLGRRVLILDADSRPLDGPGMLLNESQMAYDRMTPHTAGMLNHYLYGES
jgi:hypothetical protein